MFQPNQMYFFYREVAKHKMNWNAIIFILFCNLLTGRLSMELYDRLRHLVDYVKNHTDAQQPDLMLGIYICEGTWK